MTLKRKSFTVYISAPSNKEVNNMESLLKSFIEAMDTYHRNRSATIRENR